MLTNAHTYACTISVCTIVVVVGTKHLLDDDNTFMNEPNDFCRYFGKYTKKK